jgi:LmbE family N-acetylglucosaminyl deacetylase
MHSQPFDIRLRQTGGHAQPLVVLALGPHVDDLEIGCGATLLLLKRYYNAVVHVRVFSEHYTEPSPVDRVKEGVAAAGLMAYDSFRLYSYTDTDFPTDWRKIQHDIRDLRREIAPSLVLSSSATDTHQDHKTIARAAIREFRYGESIWFYEINQFGSPHRFTPNLYIDVGVPSRSDNAAFLADVAGGSPSVEDTLAHEKVHILQSVMTTQSAKPLLQADVLMAIMTLRAKQASPWLRYVEAFAGNTVLYTPMPLR